MEKFKECLDNIQAQGGIVWGSPVQGRELDIMILMGPFQLEILHEFSEEKLLP